MIKWLFLLVFSLHILPYHGAISLRIPEPVYTRACDGPCSPINEFIYIPCHEEACFARAEKIEEAICTTMHAPRSESVDVPAGVSSLTSCATQGLTVAKSLNPYIQTYILFTQKRE